MLAYSTKIHEICELIFKLTISTSLKFVVFIIFKTLLYNVVTIIITCFSNIKISYTSFRVAAKSDKNLMTVSNLSTCFGPTLLRPEEETVAAIMETKFFNVVIEILIENCDKVMFYSMQILTL